MVCEAETMINQIVLPHNVIFTYKKFLGGGYLNAWRGVFLWRIYKKVPTPKQENLLLSVRNSKPSSGGVTLPKKRGVGVVLGRGEFC